MNQPLTYAKMLADSVSVSNRNSTGGHFRLVMKSKLTAQSAPNMPGREASAIQPEVE